MEQSSFQINIIKPLLFIILIIFINEAYKNIIRIKETRLKMLKDFLVKLIN